MPQVYDYCMKARRPMWPPGVEIQAQAYDAFETWRQEHDPEGDRDILEMIDLYSKAMSNT